MTSFFEPISLSATHIYHTALELSPLSSVVRKLYHHRRHTPFPRVAAGTLAAWYGGVHLPGTSKWGTFTWSPCGQFIATGTKETVKIWDPLSSELFSTLNKPNSVLTGKLAYSPDGHSLASVSVVSLVIWDIQTGGVAKEIGCGGIRGVSLVWSLDGRTVCAIFLDRGAETSYTVHVYDVASGVMSFPGTLQSSDRPHLWAHNTYFQVMTTERNGRTCTIRISKVGSVLAEIETFHIKSWKQRERDATDVSFSPTTYRILVEDDTQFHILDIQSSECLLEGIKHLNLGIHCFSSDGSLFGACSASGMYIWKYSSSSYILWKE